MDGSETQGQRARQHRERRQGAHLLRAKEADFDVAVGGDAQAIASAAEVVAHRRDEANLTLEAGHLPCLGRVVRLVTVRHTARRVSNISDPASDPAFAPFTSALQVYLISRPVWSSLNRRETLLDAIQHLCIADKLQAATRTCKQRETT